MDELLEKLAKIPTVQRVAALAGLLFALVGGTYFFVVSGLEEEAQKYAAESDKLETQLEEKKAVAKDLTRYRVEVERLKQELNEALTLLPNDAEIPELLQKLAALVEHSDCDMKVFAPASEHRHGFYASIPVKITVRGNYHSIAVFFDKVAKLARIVNITGITLESPKVENKQVVLTAKFTATTYKFVQQAAKSKKKKRKRRKK